MTCLALELPACKVCSHPERRNLDVFIFDSCVSLPHASRTSVSIQHCSKHEAMPDHTLLKTGNRLEAL